MKRVPLKRTSQLRRRPRVLPEDQDARARWKEPQSGFCQCGCDPPILTMHLERHHIVPLSLIRQLRRYDMAWDLRNSLLLCPKHHSWHTTAFRRIPLRSVPDEAIVFALELLGEGSGMLYLERFYGTDLREAA